MRTFLLPILLLALSFPLMGCGGAPDVDTEGSQEMEQLEEDPNYESEMMGGESTE